LLKSLRHILRLLPLPLLAATLLCAPASAQESDEIAYSLGLAGDEPLSVSPFPRPVSKIAENLTVITADDISRLNAHTVAEVLQTVPGIHLTQLQSPGSSVFFTMLSASSNHILVQLDGVPLNFLSLENISEIGEIPVQMIDRIEIIKGASSAAWGSSLGGVINITTKSPAQDRQIGGTLSGAIAEKKTSDLRAEVTGTVERFGYYLTGGNIHSDGLTYGNGNNLNHLFGKFRYDLPDSGSVTMGVDLRDNTMKMLRLDDISVGPGMSGFLSEGDVRYLNSYLSIHYPLTDRLALEMKGRGGERSMHDERFILSPLMQIKNGKVRERYYGAALGLNWGDAERNLAAGVEYDHNDFSQREPIRNQPQINFEKSLDRISNYINGTFTLGRLSVLPGVRADRTSQYEDAFSYTLGSTFRLSDSTLLRGYAARGYSMPMINNIEIANGGRQLQNIQTLQVGSESSAIPYLWLKGTLFYNKIWNIQTFDPALMALVLRDHYTRGLDLEFRTSPFYGLALAGGYTFTDGWEKETGQTLDSDQMGARQGAKLALNYDYPRCGLRGALTGNYVDWYYRTSDHRDTAVTWDLHLNQQLLPDDDLSPELFFSVRNIFNGAQYQSPYYPNTPRWFEGGVRYRF
jgi:vitamin B12 transporter